MIPSSTKSVYLLATLLSTLAACHATPVTPMPTPAGTPSSTSSTGGDSGGTAVVVGGVAASAADSVEADTVHLAAHEVTREAVAIFGDSVAAIADSAETEPKGPSWDIDVRTYETHRRVAYYIERFTGPAKSHFGLQLARGGLYEVMIRSKLRGAGLPEDLVYLALIESGFDTHAYSRAAAVGMWQFMTATARGVGLRVDWWVDERRDPLRATDGAVKYLGWLNDQFGSLYLAAAAYNGGSGRVARGLRRYADDLQETTGDGAFFALAEKDYLRAETRDYVPKLIAAALVAKEPERYGISVQPLPPLSYDSIRVGSSTPLDAVAKAAGASLTEIRALNPYVLRGVTPPKDSLLVRLPAGTADGFRAAYSSLPKADTHAFSKRTTKKNETMAALSARANVSAKHLSWYNRGLRKTKSGRLYGGQTVLVPTPAVLAAAFDVPDPAIERYGSSGRRTVTHVVKRGESLGLIAKKYRTNVASLKRLNGLKKTVIYPGQVILVKRTAVAARKAKPRK